MSHPRIVYIADTDSQLRPAFLVAQAIQKAVGGVVVGNLIPGKRSVSYRQVNASDVQGALLGLPLDKFLKDKVDDFDVIVAMLAGSRLFGIRKALEARQQLEPNSSRPILVTGYNGVIYEKQLEGLLWRTGYDTICVNSRADQRSFEHFLQQLGMSPEALAYTGPPLIQARLENGAPSLPPAEAPVKTVLFATQAIVPERLSERTYLIAKLREYALVHPDRTVLIKPRTRPNETTFHEENNHYEAVYREAFGQEIPSNMHFAYGTFGQYLSDCDLVTAVSSTAVMEAMAAGVRAAVLTDVGIAETLGNHFFLGSGLLCSTDDLIADRLPSLNAEWATENGLDRAASMAAVGERVGQLLRARAEAGGALPWAPCYYEATTSAAIADAWITSDLNPGWRPPKGGTFAFSKAPKMFPAPIRKLRKLYSDPRGFFRDAAAKRRAAKFSE